VLGVGEGDLGTVPLSYPKKIAQVLEKGATGTFLNTSPFRKSKASTSSCSDNIWEKYGSRKTAAM
jgi:hypothetical protein